MALQGNRFWRASSCNADHRASRATTDQLKEPACRCRDYRTRFATTRKPCLSRRARRKPQRFDRPNVPAVGDEVGQSRVCRRSISAHVLREREFETAITFVGLQLRFTQRRFTVAALNRDRAPAIDEWKQQPAATLRLCAPPHPPHPVFPQSKECEPG